MLKLYVVARVWLYVRKGRKIDAIRFVRSHLSGRYRSMGGLREAKRFVDDVNYGMWPETY